MVSGVMIGDINKQLSARKAISHMLSMALKSNTTLSFMLYHFPKVSPGVVGF
jgi:hypothetical protein